METYLDRLIDSLRRLEANARLLARQDHQAEQCLDLLVDAGSTVERFLAGSIYSTATGAAVRKLDDLVRVGVEGADISALHTLRRYANAAKHDPAFRLTVDHVITCLVSVTRVVLGWRGRNLGTSEHPAPHPYVRHLWIACWDYYAHGDSEIHVMGPVDEAWVGFVPSIDTIYVPIDAWPSVVDALGQVVRPAEGIVPRRFMDEWRAEADFAGARVYDGSYRELVRALSAKELRLDLLPELKRETDFPAMRSALAFAAVDAVRTSPADIATSDLKEVILHIATSEYAAPRTARLAQELAEEYVTLVGQVDAAVRLNLGGPRVVAREQFVAMMSTALARARSALISSHGELILQT